jgi:hypothetical protein
MLDFWFDQRPLVRFGLSLIVLGVCAGIWFAGWFWPYGWVIGGVMLLGSFPSSSEKSGYNF